MHIHELTLFLIHLNLLYFSNSNIRLSQGDRGKETTSEKSTYPPEDVLTKEEIFPP
jgi:hypothetical protein